LLRIVRRDAHRATRSRWNAGGTALEAAGYQACRAVETAAALKAGLAA
jgi:hypothetical protein